MKDILDEIEPDKPIPGKVFSILSFAFAMLTLVLGIFLIVKTQALFSKINVSSLRYPPMILIRGFQIACLSGLIFAIASMVKKEKLRYLKAIGAILNFLIFGLILGLIVFAAIINMSLQE